MQVEEPRFDMNWTLTDGEHHRYRKWYGSWLFHFLEIVSDEKNIVIRNTMIDILEVPDAERSLAMYECALDAVGFADMRRENRIRLAEHLYAKGIGYVLGEKEFPDAQKAVLFLEHYTGNNLDNGSFKDYDLFDNEPYLTCYTSESPESVNHSYTRQDILELCNGDVLKAEMVFGLCDWQHPSTILYEWDEDDEEALLEKKTQKPGA